MCSGDVCEIKLKHLARVGKRKIEKMEILNTSSLQCKILIHNNKKYVIRYPRKIGKTVEYYRSTPETEVIKVLQNNRIKCPKVLYSNENYSIQEYVEGQLLADKFEDHKSIEKNIITQIADQICLLKTVDGTELLKYASWKDNRSFYYFQCQNTEKVFMSYYQNLEPVYKKLGISLEIIKKLYNLTFQISNERKLSVIHGDRHKKNVIVSENGDITFIDWELGCIGDLAYDIGFHLHQMAYTEGDEKYFLDKIVEEFDGDSSELLHDVELYRLFLLARSTLYHVYWTDLEYQKNDKDSKEKQLGHFMGRYNKLSKYKSFNLEPKSQEELNCIFEEYRKNQKNSELNGISR